MFSKKGSLFASLFCFYLWVELLPFHSTFDKFLTPQLEY